MAARQRPLDDGLVGQEAARRGQKRLTVGPGRAGGVGALLRITVSQGRAARSRGREEKQVRRPKYHEVPAPPYSLLSLPAPQIPALSRLASSRRSTRPRRAGSWPGGGGHPSWGGLYTVLREPVGTAACPKRVAGLLLAPCPYLDEGTEGGLFFRRGEGWASFFLFFLFFSSFFILFYCDMKRQGGGPRMHARRQSLELVVEGGVVPPGRGYFLRGRLLDAGWRDTTRQGSWGPAGWRRAAAVDAGFQPPRPAGKWHQICLPALSAAHESGHGAPFRFVGRRRDKSGPRKNQPDGPCGRGATPDRRRRLCRMSYTASPVLCKVYVHVLECAIEAIMGTEYSVQYMYVRMCIHAMPGCLPIANPAPRAAAAAASIGARYKAQDARDSPRSHWRGVASVARAVGLGCAVPPPHACALAAAAAVHYRSVCVRGRCPTSCAASASLSVSLALSAPFPCRQSEAGVLASKRPSRSRPCSWLLPAQAGAVDTYVCASLGYVRAGGALHWPGLFCFGPRSAVACAEQRDIHTHTLGSRQTGRLAGWQAGTASDEWEQRYRMSRQRLKPGLLVGAECWAACGGGASALVSRPRPL